MLNLWERNPLLTNKPLSQKVQITEEEEVDDLENLEMSREEFKNDLSVITFEIPASDCT